MRKLILALLLLLAAAPASAEDRLAWGGSMMMVGGGTAAGGTLGYTEIGTDNDVVGGAAAWMYRVQASMSGTLTFAHLYEDASSLTGWAKVFVYNSTNADPNSETAGATLVGGTGSWDIIGSAAWRTGAITGSVVAGNYYWIVVLAGGDGWPTKHNTNSGMFYYPDTSALDWWNTPEDPLPNAGWTSDTGSPISVYVDIS